MKTVIKKWQLLSCKTRKRTVDLREEEFLSVGNRAMRKSRRYLEEARLPEGVSAVKGGAFADCRRLYRVSLSETCGVGVGTEAFRGCIRLHEVLPFAGIVSIGERAFFGCTMLREIPMGEHLRAVGAYAFARCASLEEAVLPSRVSSVGKGAFSDCTELIRFRAEEGITALAPELLRGCISLCEVTLPEGLAEIPDGFFRDCSALERLTLPTGVRRIGRQAMRGCRSLREVRAELGLTRIGRGAFRDTPALTDVYLPHTVKRLDFCAFGFGRLKGTGREKVKLHVDTEYMLRRLKRQLFFCGSYGRAEVILDGKTIEERKRERRRSTLEKTPAHLTDYTAGTPRDD